MGETRTPREIINNALTTAEGEASIEEYEERAAYEWLDALEAERDRLRGEVAALREALENIVERIQYGVSWNGRIIERTVQGIATAALAAVPAGCPLAGGTRGERVRAVEIDIHGWHEVQRLANALIFQMHLDDDMLGGHMREDRDALESMLDALDAPPAGREEGDGNGR